MEIHKNVTERDISTIKTHPCSDAELGINDSATSKFFPKSE